jgi:hypothetical protein
MFIVQRDGSRFWIRSETHDQGSQVNSTIWLTFDWRDANELQTKLSQLLLDFEIERGAYPMPDDEDYVESCRIGEPF